MNEGAQPVATPRGVRPIDELAEDAAVSYRQNASTTFVVDEHGVEYRPPKWLQRLLESAERRGVIWAQHEMRDALGLEEMLCNHAQAIHDLSRQIAAVQAAGASQGPGARSQEAGASGQASGTPGTQPCPVCSEPPGPDTVKVRIVTGDIDLSDVDLADPDTDQQTKL